MKLSLGTAQFGSNYGVCNKSGIIKKKEIKKILSFCKKNISKSETKSVDKKHFKVHL